MNQGMNQGISCPRLLWGLWAGPLGLQWDVGAHSSLFLPSGWPSFLMSHWVVVTGSGLALRMGLPGPATCLETAVAGSAVRGPELSQGFPAD